MIMGFHYRPKLYYGLTFAVTYILWSIGAYFSFQEDAQTLYMIFMLPGLMAPFLISLVFIFTAKNRALVKDFLRRTFNPALINIKTLPVMFLIMPVAVVLSILLSLFVGGSLEQFGLAEEFSFSSGFVPVLLLLLLAASFEELGWRGYAFDSLQSRFNYFQASLIFSVLWSLWHLPLLWVNNSYQYEIYHQNIGFALNFFISIIPMGIIISWICIKNNKSVLAAILFHFIINLSQEALGMTQITKSIETVVLFIFCGFIIYLDRDLFFRSKP